MNATHRVDGFAPIEDYAVLGDGRTVALLAADGSVDWWALPALDSPPVLSGLLDPDGGGRLTLRPRMTTKSPAATSTTPTSSRPSTAIDDRRRFVSPPRSTWVRLAGFPGPNSPNGSKSSAGFVDLNWAFTPGDRFGRASPWVTDRHGTPVASVEDQTLGVILDGLGPADVTPHSVSGHCRLERRAHEHSSPSSPPTPSRCSSRRRPPSSPDSTGRSCSWRRWAGLLSGDGPWDHAVRRSALALKTLLAEHSGAIAAAATTSLPSAIGGTKNWDYRYAWVRDSSFTLDALINLGLHEEVHGAVSWLLSAIRDNGGDLHVFYSLDGTVADEQETLDIPGWRHSQPVAPELRRRADRSSAPTATSSTPSAAIATKDISSTRPPAACWPIWPTAAATGGDTRLGHLGTRRPPALHHLQDRLLGRSRPSRQPGGVGPDPRPRTSSAGAQAPTRSTPGSTPTAGRDAKQAYTFYAGTDDLDAAVLLAGRTGFDRGPRLASTIDAIAAELGRGRSSTATRGMDEEEGAFVACSFWMVDALVQTGQTERPANSWRTPSRWPTTSGSSPNRSTLRPAPSWATCPKACRTSR